VAGICGLNSINTLALIAVDRYKVISQPLRSLYAVSGRRSALLVGVAWLWAAVWAVPPLTNAWGRYIGEGFQVHCRDVPLYPRAQCDDLAAIVGRSSSSSSSSSPFSSDNGAESISSSIAVDSTCDARHSATTDASLSR